MLHADSGARASTRIFGGPRMPPSGVWRMFGVLFYLASPASGFGTNYAEDYNNILVQMEASPAPPWESDESTHWDRLFTALEDSHKRQNMVLDSLGQCCGCGMASLQTKVTELANGTCRRFLPELETMCRGQAKEVGARLLRGLAEISEERAAREREINATLCQLLRDSQEQSARLQRLEEDGRQREADSGGGPMEAGNSQTGPMRQRRGGLGVGLGLGLKSFSTDLKQQEVISQVEGTKVEETLVTIEMEIQKLHVQLGKLMGTLGMNEEGQRGDTNQINLK